MPVSRVKTRKNSYILTALFLIAVCYFVFSWVDLHGKAQVQQQNIASVEQKKEAQLYENAEMKRMLSAENREEYLERKARIENGFVLPGERVYYDVSAGDN